MFSPVSAWVVCAAIGGLVLLAGCARMHRGDYDFPPPRQDQHKPPLEIVPSTRPAATEPATAEPVVEKGPREVVLGRSGLGKTIAMRVFGQGDGGVLIIGGIHGDEPTGADVAAELADYIKAKPQVISGRPVAIITRANPDGLAKGKRTNAAGVDINRNFPASNYKATGRGRNNSGEEAASEPETAAIIKAVDSLNPRLIIAIHAIGRGSHCNNYDGPGRAVAKFMAKSNGYPVKATIGYPTPGSFGSWAGIDRKIAVITLEMPADLSADECWKANRDALLAAIAGPPDGK